MKHFLLAALILLVSNIQTSYADKIHLTSINNLIEQEVGQIIIGKIYDELNIPHTIKPMPAKRAKYETSNGLLDGEVMRTYNYGMTTANVLRVPTPYYSIETMPFYKHNSKIKIESAKDLTLYRIAIVRGVQHTEDITQGLPNVIQLNTTRQIMRFVLKGRADIALTSTFNGIRALKKLNITTIKPANQPLINIALYHYLNKKNKNLIPAINNKIIELKQNKKLKAMIEDAKIKVNRD